MEGVSGEASSLAGFLGLGKLCLIYDDNHITIEGSTGLAFGEDVGLRYEAYGFHVQRLADGWTTDDLRAALDAADAETERPSLIIVRTHIAIGAPHAQDTPESHGAPLGEEEVRLTKQAYGWDPDRTFYVPDEVYAHFSPARARRRRARRLGRACTPPQLAADPARVGEFDRVLSGELPAGWEDALPDFSGGDAQATRVSSGACIAALAAAIPELIGGSADLAPSNNTTIKGDEAIAGAPLANKENAKADSVLPGRMGGRTLHFGIREHGMGAILNGLVVHGGFRAFGATFFVFSDYMRPAVRLACIMELPVIYVWTHDSIGLGEDGPTHQPIEHLASLRAMPHMRVIRPADATETAEAWRLALERTDGPVGLALSRQKLPVLDRIGARARERRAPRRLRPGRRRRRARRDPDRLRLRGARPAGRARDAERRGRRRARRLAARLEPLHGAAAELPRRGAAAGRVAARLARGRRDVRLVGARRRPRHGARAGSLRRLGAGSRRSRASSGSRPRPSSRPRARLLRQ